MKIYLISVPKDETKPVYDFYSNPLEYYWNPLFLSIGLVGFSVLSGLTPQLFSDGAILISLLGIFFISALWAWLVAIMHVIKGVYAYKMQDTSWKHYFASAFWTFVCYLIFLIMSIYGYIIFSG